MGWYIDSQVPNHYHIHIYLVMYIDHELNHILYIQEYHIVRLRDGKAIVIIDIVNIDI